MKTILVTLATVITSAALAMPAVGDKATYNGTTIQAGTTYNFVVENAIISQDATTGFFNIDQTLTYNGQTQVKSIQEDPANLPTDAAVSSYLTNCTMIGGKLETITVPAGTFDTCSVTTDTGTLWIAQVPFGIAKSVRGDEQIELQSFAHGK